jgi:hypothetical protein
MLVRDLFPLRTARRPIVQLGRWLVVQGTAVCETTSRARNGD